MMLRFGLGWMGQSNDAEKRDRLGGGAWNTHEAV